MLSDGKGMVRYERTLEKMMREASNDSRFEEAIEIRETLRDFQRTTKHGENQYVMRIMFK